ncbi:hypothetical protein ABT297_04240 [Dactylosporangium sp. NPDC000555]|uniref:hypothetical protein n=1 Tax=Dactylosporangium sp. NPDC000555 TaxID=3154260 RepID=UPI0033165E98
MNVPLREPTYAADDLGLPEPDHQYPVIVTVHKEYVVWVPDAADQAEALSIMRDDPEWYELINDQKNLANFWEEMRSPGGDSRSSILAQLDWDLIYKGHGDGPYESLNADAHVRTHQSVQWAAEYAAKREAEKADCVAAGHPEVRFYSSGDPHCQVCGSIKAEQLVADIRAAAQRAGQVTA